MASYAFDTSHSHVAFSVRHMVFSKVRGEFTRWSATLELDEQSPAASKVTASIEVDSIDTHEPKRDGHLKSADFFDAESHKLITFASKQIEPAGKGKLKVQGDLTIRGTTRPITLEVEELGRGKDPWGNERIGYSASASIDRRDFGLTWNQALETGGLLVGEKVDITIDVEVLKSA